MSVNKYLRKAQNLKRNNCYFQAQEYYVLIIEQLTKDILSTNNEKKIQKKRAIIADVTLRLQHLEYEIDFNGFKSAGTMEATIQIPAQAHFDLETFYGKYANDQVTEIMIFERDVLKQEHLDKHLELVRILQKCCPKLKYLILKCHQPGHGMNKPQLDMITAFKAAWPITNLACNIQFCEQFFLDGYKMVFNNGFIFIADRDLNQYLPSAAADQRLASKIEVWSHHVLELYGHKC